MGIGDWAQSPIPNPNPHFDYRNNNISILKCNNFNLIKDQNENIFIF